MDNDRRRLPPRAARTLANLNLDYNNDSDEEFPDNIDGDDVAYDNVVQDLDEIEAGPIDQVDEELDLQG